ncbi:hypothetical protein KJ633_01800 [bacterium]|nr:hypothetical protein [bacterium]MBU3955174.1 hypothetical protein [bacterium]
MLFGKVRFCMAKGKLIREVECAVCKIPPAARYDRRLEERRAGGESEDHELRKGKGNRVKRYPLCPGFFRMPLLKIFYATFKTPFAGVSFILILCAVVLIGAGIRFKYLWKTEKPAPPISPAQEDIKKNFVNFVGGLQREFTEYTGKNKYSIQIVVTANKAIDGFREKYQGIPETVPGEIIDSMFLDSFEFYFGGANILFDSYFNVDAAQRKQIVRRLELWLTETENLFSDWNNVSERLPDYVGGIVHIVYVRKIKNSLTLFSGNISKLKSGNVIAEPLLIPAFDIKKLVR